MENFRRSSVKNLLKNDLKLLFRDNRSTLIIFLGLPLLSIFISGRGYMGMASIYTIITFMIVVGLGSNETKISPEKLFLSLPVTRREMVLSRYLMFLIMFIPATIIVASYGLVFKVLGLRNILIIGYEQVIILFLQVSLILSLVLPWFYVLSLPVAQGIGVFIIIFSQNLLYKDGDFSQPAFNNLYARYGALGILGLSLLILGISAYFSILIYKNRDL